jgi:hypothetical protein
MCLDVVIDERMREGSWHRVSRKEAVGGAKQQPQQLFGEASGVKIMVDLTLSNKT